MTAADGQDRAAPAGPAQVPAPPITGSRAVITARPVPVTSRPYPARRSARGSVLPSMLHTTDRKDRAILYLVTSFGFFLIGGAMGLLMRVELTVPGQQFLSNEQDDQLVTMHGTIMLLLYATPILYGFGTTSCRYRSAHPMSRSRA